MGENLKVADKGKSTEKSDSYVSLYFFEIRTGVLFTYTYLFASIMLNIINRVLYNTYHFKFNFFLLLIQQLTAIICFQLIFPKFKNYQEKVGGNVSLNEFLAKKWVLLAFSLCFVANLMTSFIGNQTVNTQMFLCLRKFLLIMNFMYDLFVNKKDLPGHFSISVVLIVIGNFLSGMHDLTSELSGYLIVILNNVLTVATSQLTENFKKNHGVSSVRLLIYNSFIVIPSMIVLIFLTGEHTRLGNFEGYTLGFFLCLLCSCLLTVVLNASFFISNEANSSLFTMLCSNCKDIFITGIGFVLLKDFVLSIHTISGMMCATAGASYFSFKTIIENIRGASKAEEPKK